MMRNRMGELRAGRAGRLRWILVPLALAALLALPHWIGTRTYDDPEPEMTEAAAPEPEFVTISDTIRRGDTFTGILMRNELSMQEIGRILELNRRLQLFSPRSLQPGQTLTLVRDEDGRLIEMSLALSIEETYVFEAQGDSLAARLLPVDREVRLRKFEGEIATSFGDAVLASGGDYKLALKVADMFAYDVDFFTEVRRGDRFSLLVEERCAGGRPIGFGEVLYGRYEGDQAKSVALWYPVDGHKGGYFDPDGRSLRKSFLRSPLNYGRISSHYSSSRFHPILKTWRPHHGVDYAAPEGTPVVAVADGTVSFAGWKGGYGRALILQHAGRMDTTYGHLRGFSSGVRRGAKVSQGQVIGYVGRTGLATGPHLHFEMAQNGRRMNPERMKSPPAEPIPPAKMQEFRRMAERLQTLDRELLAGQVLESFEPGRIEIALASLEGAHEPSPLP